MHYHRAAYLQRKPNLLALLLYFFCSLCLLLLASSTASASSSVTVELPRQQQQQQQQAPVTRNASRTTTTTTTTTTRDASSPPKNTTAKSQRQQEADIRHHDQHDQHDQHEAVDVIFVNFANHAVGLWWHNPTWKEYDQIGLLEPFESRRINSYVGHTFAYDLMNTPRIIYNVVQKSAATTSSHKIHLIGIDHHKQMDYSNKKEYPTRRPPTGEPQVKVQCSTTQGDIAIAVQPTWSPLGAARFLELVASHYYDGCAIHRVVPNFVAQFGISPNYQQRMKYNNLPILDDQEDESHVTRAFRPGYLSFAGLGGPNSRTTQVFVVAANASPQNLAALGQNPWEIPFGYVDVDNDTGSSSLTTAKWYSEYGDTPPWGNGPDPKKLLLLPDAYDTYLQQEFPELDYIETCRIVDFF